MSRTHTVVRGALLLGAAAVFAACNTDNTVVGVTPANALFTNYVALGNSITAGWQSGGINDSTQRQSYAFLLAQQMNTRFAYPSFPKPGCPAPTGNFVSQKRIDSLTPVPGGCTFRAASPTVLNNVGIPYAYASDLTLTGGTLLPAPYAQLVLGGVSQVDRALQADPTFATLWIGNNELLLPASTGFLQPPATVAPPLIPPTVFIPAYAAAVNKLKTAPNLKGGVLVGVVNVTNAPRFFSADTLGLSVTRKADWDFVTGKTNTIVGCGISGYLVSVELIAQIKSGAHPPIVSCIKNQPAAPVGDAAMLDPTEVATISATAAAYNAYIKAKADSIGFAYVDPNPILQSLRGSGTSAAIPTWPNLRSTTAPFGTYISMDGAHPAQRGQVVIANAIIDAINAKYGTALAKLPIP